MNYRSLFSLKLMIALFTAFIISVPIYYAAKQGQNNYPGFNDNKYGFTDLPIVVQESGIFVQRIHYSSARSRYYILLDWEAAIHPNSGVWATQQFKHLTALKKNYPVLFSNVQNSDAFLRKYNRFLVHAFSDYKGSCPPFPKGLHSVENWYKTSHCPQWINMRLINTGQYNVQLLGQCDDDNYVLLLVTKRSS